MGDVNSDFYKDVKHIFDRHFWNRDETTVTIVDNEITPEFATGQVVDATGSVRHIAQDQTLHLATLVTTEVLNHISY